MNKPKLFLVNKSNFDSIKYLAVINANKLNFRSHASYIWKKIELLTEINLNLRNNTIIIYNTRMGCKSCKIKI